MADNTTEEGLKRVIGIPGLTLSIINGVVGAGIFVLPATVGMALGAFAFNAYVVCGVLLSAILLCYAEIGTRVTTSGGSYAYVEAAFGPLPGYVINWLYFFGWSILGSAALMNIIADSLAALFPAFENAWMRAMVFVVMVAFMIWINIIGAQQGVRLVKVITILKLLPLIGIILLGIRLIRPDNLHWNGLPSLQAFGDTTLILFFAFSGFETSLGASGEIKNPMHTVPRSIIIAGIAIVVLYLLLQTVVQGILGPDLALYKGAPLAAVAQQIIGPAGAVILLACAALSCFGSVTMDIFCTPRSLFAGARDGMFPSFLAQVHPRFATPYVAVFLYGLMILIVSVAGGFQSLAILASACILLIYLAVVLAMVRLRFNRPTSAPQGFKAPGGWFTPIVAIMTILWLLSSLGKMEMLATLIFIVVIIMMYFITMKLKPRLQPIEIKDE